MTEVLELIVGQIVGNVATVFFFVLLYYNFLLFEDYFRLIVWAFLLSQALRGAKKNVVGILQRLSKLQQPLLSGLWQTASNYALRQPTTKERRSVKAFLLDHGIFIFAMVGAVSVVLRMMSWSAFIIISLSLSIVFTGALWLIDRRVFYYRYCMSDEVLVTTILIIGMFMTGTFVILYLGIESFMEGSQATSDISNYLQEKVINDETTRRIFSEQVTNAKATVSDALLQVEENYSDTMWWPPIKNLMVEYYDRFSEEHKNGTTSSSSVNGFLAESFPENLTMIQAISHAKEKFNALNFTMDQLTDWSATGLGMSSYAFGSFAQLIVFVATVLAAFIGLGIRAMFFFTSLFYMLRADIDPVEKFVYDCLPLEPETKPVVFQSLRLAIEGVFFLPVKISSLHAIVTLLSFNFLEVDFGFLATFLTFVISVAPIIPPFLVCVPWAITICFTSSLVRGLSLFLIHYFAYGMIDEALYEKNLKSLNSYVSALSVVFGVYVFGVEGVVFGPLLVCGVTFALDLSNHGIQATANDNDSAKEKKGKNERRRSSEGLAAAPNSIFRRLSGNDFAPDSSARNIFSNAYRAISGHPLRGLNNIRRSSSSTAPDERASVTMTLLVENSSGLDDKKYRFVASKEWNMDELIEAIGRSLHLNDIEGLYSLNGEEILEVGHIEPKEMLSLRLGEGEHSDNPQHLPVLFANATPHRRHNRRRLNAFSPRTPAARYPAKGPRPYGQRTRVSSRTAKRRGSPKKTKRRFSPLRFKNRPSPPASVENPAKIFDDDDLSVESNIVDATKTADGNVHEHDSDLCVKDLETKLDDNESDDDVSAANVTIRKRRKQKFKD